MSGERPPRVSNRQKVALRNWRVISSCFWKKDPRDIPPRTRYKLPTLPG